MEMKIYERQVIKQSISKRVIDEQQIDRHYNQNDLAELYKYVFVCEIILLSLLLHLHDSTVIYFFDSEELHVLNASKFYDAQFLIASSSFFCASSAISL